ncbi:MAG: co-chaperone GroES [Clostridia bacterium]|nr:co-chaperone GroES [Clostridia bacterium]
MKIEPLFDRVLLIPQENTNTTKSGIILPSTAQEKPQIGIVEAIGSGGMMDGEEIVMQVKVGQKVLYNKYAGSELKLNNVNYVILRQSDIIGVLVN